MLHTEHQEGAAVSPPIKRTTELTTRTVVAGSLVSFSINQGKAECPADLDALIDLCAVLSGGLCELVHKHLPGAVVVMDVAENITLGLAAQEVFSRVEAIRQSAPMAAGAYRSEPAPVQPGPPAAGSHQR